jgi:RNA polymerase sigma-70 factor (family 1)
MSYYQTKSDQELTTLLYEGDERAYTEIYERYHCLLYIYAHKKLNDKQEAQDIIHEVLTTLWSRRFDFSMQTSLPSYLFTSVRNKSLDLFSHKKVESRYLASLQNFIEDTGTQTDFLIRENDLKNLIEKEIQSLPPRMKEAFQLSRKDQLTHKEIANLMDISEHTVSTQIKKALRILRVRLGFIIYLIMLLSKKFYFFELSVQFN